MLFLTYIFILLIFIVISFTLYKVLKLYLNFREKGQSANHYPITLGITLLSIPLISKVFLLPAYIIKVFNQYTSANLPIPKDDWKSMIFYVLYILAVIVLTYIYYTLQPRDKAQFKDKGASQKIDYPDNTEVIVSPHLHKRVQELFELKYEKLKLFYDEKEKVLVGNYSDAIHSYRYLIYCDSELKKVPKSKQDEIFEHLKELSKDFTIGDNTYYEPKYLFFIEEGNFEENDNKYLNCYTENTFLNVVIDFSSYLQKNIERFDTNPIDIGGVSLKDSFIEPSFNKGETNLKTYFDEWLEEKSLRHISLLADYGMGKTSFLKYYTKYLSQKILNGEHFSRYPVFISLTNTSPMSNDGIETKIESFVSRELGVNYALFERLVHLGKIVFVLDGFDEMGFIGTAKTRFEQFNSIWQLATVNNKILISGRPSYLPTDFERKNVLNIVEESLADVQQVPFTEVIELDYFELEKIEQTVNIYYEDKNVEKYMDYIKRNRSILDLCKRPSMLHMTMSILPDLYSENSTKIITSSDIMNKYTEYWISRQESKAITGYFSKNDNRKKEFLINFFTELSGEMFKKGTLVISKTDLDKLIDKELIGAQIDIALNNAMLEGLKNELYAGYFIEVDITNIKDNHFKFVHKSIFEFFVSQKIIKLIDEQKFNDKLISRRWNHEVTNFINDSIDYEKYKNSKYPSLIMLRNSWLDKWFFIPLTYISRQQLEYINMAITFFIFLILYLIDLELHFILEIYIALGILVVLEKVFQYLFKDRKKFISKAYILFRRRNNLEYRQLQHFLDKGYFKSYSNLSIQGYTFEKVKSTFTFIYCNLKAISFRKSKINLMTLYYSSLEDIDFSNSKIKYLKLEGCSVKRINFYEVKFIGMWRYQKILVRVVYFLIDIFRTFFKKFITNNVLNRFQIYRRLVVLIQSKIIFKNMEIKDFDSISLENFQNFIKNNNIKRKDLICTSSELKDKLFAKLEGKE